MVDETLGPPDSPLGQRPPGHSKIGSQNPGKGPYSNGFPHPQHASANPIMIKDEPNQASPHTPEASQPGRGQPRPRGRRTKLALLLLAVLLGGGTALSTFAPEAKRAQPGAAGTAAETSGPSDDPLQQSSGENPALPDFQAQSKKLLYLVLAAEMALQLKDPATAAGIYARALNESGDVKDDWLPNRAAQLALLARDWQLTLSASLAALKRDTDDSAAAARGALAAVNSGNFKVASDLIWRRKPLCTSADPLAEARCNQEKTEALWGRMHKILLRDQLLAFCRAAPAESRRDLAFLDLCGNSALQAGDRDAATLAAESMLALYDENIKGWMLLARASIGGEREEEAFSGLSELIDRLNVDLGQDPGTMRLYTDLLIRAGRNGEVQTLIHRLKNRSGPPEQLLYPGLKLWQRGAHDEARKWLSHFADQKPPVRWLANHYLGLMAEEQQDHGAALEHYRRVAGGAGHHESVRRAASLQARRGDLKAALDTLARSRASMDENEFEPRMRSWLTESRLLSEARNLKRAAGSLGRGLRQLGDWPQSQIHLFYARGLILRRLEQVPAFIDDMESTLSIDPDFPPALNALAYYWIEEDIHLDRARIYLDRALKSDPTTARSSTATAGSNSRSATTNGPWSTCGGRSNKASTPRSPPT